MGGPWQALGGPRGMVLGDLGELLQALHQVVVVALALALVAVEGGRGGDGAIRGDRGKTA